MSCREEKKSGEGAPTSASFCRYQARALLVAEGDTTACLDMAGDVASRERVVRSSTSGTFAVSTGSRSCRRIELREMPAQLTDQEVIVSAHNAVVKIALLGEHEDLLTASPSELDEQAQRRIHGLHWEKNASFTLVQARSPGTRL